MLNIYFGQMLSKHMGLPIQMGNIRLRMECCLTRLRIPVRFSAFSPNRLCSVRSTTDIYFMQQVEALNGTLRAAKRQKKVTVLKFAGYIDDREFFLGCV